MTEEQAKIAEDLFKFLADMRQWQETTFGPRESRGPNGPLKHLEKEAREASEEEYGARQLIEISDCFFLTMEAVWRSGMGLSDLISLSRAKLEENQARNWPTPTADGAVEHIRE